MKRISAEKVVILVAALSQLYMQLIANMATIIIPEIAMELNITTELQLWINIIYLCSLVAVSIPLSKIISQYGVKKSVMISYVLGIISLLFCGLSTNFYMILIGRLIQGICCASLGMSIYIMLVEELDEKALGTALGLVGSSGYVGLTMAPSMTGLITSFFGWRTAFLLLIPFFIVQIILLCSIKTEWTREKVPYDRTGSLIYIIMMVFFTIGLSKLDSVYCVFLLFSLILLPIFIKHERKQEYPMLNLKLFENIEVSIGFYAAMIAYFVTSIAITVLTFHLIYPMDIDLSTASMIMLITPCTMVFISVLAGKLSGEIDPRMISGCALLVIFVAMFMFTFLGSLPLELIIVACLIQGIGHGFFSSPNNKYVLTVVDDDDISDTSAVLSTSKEFGKILSSGIYTLLFSIFLKDIVLGPPQYDNALIYTNHIMMAITCILTLSATFLLFYSLFRHERRETPTRRKLAMLIKRANIRREERRRKRRELIERRKAREQERKERIKTKENERKERVKAKRKELKEKIENREKQTK